MSERGMSRRDFSVLSLAALGGTLIGCESTDQKKMAQHDHILLKEPHVCRGLNTCKGKGKGDHACAGQGGCATAEAHACKGQNECAGQGGCGERPGENATCKGTGNCAVPLNDDAWKRARANFEAAAKKAGLEVGPAPGSDG